MIFGIDEKTPNILLLFMRECECESVTETETEEREWLQEKCVGIAYTAA